MNEYKFVEPILLLQREQIGLKFSIVFFPPSETAITYYKTYIETLTEIINVLKWRHSTIKNIIDWRRFESGG